MLFIPLVCVGGTISCSHRARALLKRVLIRTSLSLSLSEVRPLGVFHKSELRVLLNAAVGVQCPLTVFPTCPHASCSTVRGPQAGRNACKVDNAMLTDDCHGVFDEYLPPLPLPHPSTLVCLCATIHILFFVLIVLLGGSLY